MKSIKKLLEGAYDYRRDDSVTMRSRAGGYVSSDSRTLDNAKSAAAERQLAKKQAAYDRIVNSREVQRVISDIESDILQLNAAAEMVDFTTGDDPTGIYHDLIQDVTREVKYLMNKGVKGYPTRVWPNMLIKNFGRVFKSV